MASRKTFQLVCLSLTTIMIAAACSPADAVRPEQTPSGGAEPDRMILTIASQRPDGFLELDTISVVATVFTKKGGEVDIGNVTWERHGEFGIEAGGPRRATIRLHPGTNALSASYRKADGSVLSETLLIPAHPAKAVAVVWESDGTVTTFLPPPNVEVIRPNAINDRGEVVGTAEVEASSKWAWIWSKSEGFRFIAQSRQVDTEANDINEDGTVVGYRRTDLGFSAFRWTQANGFVTLEGSSPANALSLNDAGVTTGLADYRAVRWRPDGRVDTLPLTPEGKCSAASAIGSTGYVVGYVGESFFDGWCLHASPVLWSPDGSVNVLRDCSNELDCGYYLQDVNGEGEVLGNRPGGKPFRWSRPDGFRDLPGDATGRAFAINDRGEVAGAAYYPYALPTVWDREGNPRTLPLPSGRHAGSAHAINNRGDVVGVVK